MKEIDISHGTYSSNYNLTDFYPESEEKLREALASGEDFTTGWIGCKQEIHSVRYSRKENRITIEVSARMDDLWESNDLIYDALWSSCQVEEELPDDFTDSIRECLGDDIDDHTEITIVLPASASFEEIMAATGQAENNAEQNNTRMFDFLCEIVKEHWMQMKGLDITEPESLDNKEPGEGPVLKM